MRSGDCSWTRARVPWPGEEEWIKQWCYQRSHSQESRPTQTFFICDNECRRENMQRLPEMRGRPNCPHAVCPRRECLERLNCIWIDMVAEFTAMDSALSVGGSCNSVCDEWRSELPGYLFFESSDPFFQDFRLTMFKICQISS